MDDETVQTVALSDEQIDEILDRGYVITDESAFATSSGWDELKTDGYDGSIPWTSVSDWESLRDDHEREAIAWEHMNIKVVAGGAEETDDQSSIDRESVGEMLLELFEEADGETKQRVNDVIHELGFGLERTYEIVDEQQ